MQRIRKRSSLEKIQELMRQFAALALLGPLQVGKTTLSRRIANDLSGVYFDLERLSDRLKLSDPELALGALADRLVVLDEVQRTPGLFETLRPLIDEQRRPGRFLLLGSASPDLLQQASESLAGRMGIVELAPFSVTELGIDFDTLPKYLLRGGFPQSWLAPDDDASFEWRDAFVRSFLERDMPQFGFRFPAATLQRFWTMLAHWHGQLWNASRLAQSMGVSAPAIGRYLDALAGAFMLRSLQPMEANVMKRLVKSPRNIIGARGLVLAGQRFAVKPAFQRVLVHLGQCQRQQRIERRRSGVAFASLFLLATGRGHSFKVGTIAWLECVFTLGLTLDKVARMKPSDIFFHRLDVI